MYIKILISYLLKRSYGIFPAHIRYCLISKRNKIKISYLACLPDFLIIQNYRLITKLVQNDALPKNTINYIASTFLENGLADQGLLLLNASINQE